MLYQKGKPDDNAVAWVILWRVVSKFVSETRFLGYVSTLVGYQYSLNKKAPMRTAMLLFPKELTYYIKRKWLQSTPASFL
jgi:hypothetical protein